MPRFSVIVPAYNAAETLSTTIDSVMGQTTDDFELIVVDDGSTDNTLGVAQTYAQTDSRIHILGQENAGVAAARNHGVAQASADLIAPLDADDSYEPEYLQTLGDVADRHPEAAIFSSSAHMEYRGKRLILPRDKRFRQATEVSLRELMVSNPITSASLVRANVFAATGGYRSGVHVEDYDLWLRALAMGFRHRHTPEPLYVYHVSSGSRSADVVASAESVARVLNDLCESGSIEGDDQEFCRHQARRTREIADAASRRSNRDAQTDDNASAVQRALDVPASWLLALNPRLYRALLMRRS